MNEKNLKDLVEKQIDNFLYAGEVALDLRNKGLNKEIKSDGTPVSNGDLEVNRIITKKILELTPDLPIVSEETSHNKLPWATVFMNLVVSDSELHLQWNKASFADN